MSGWSRQAIEGRLAHFAKQRNELKRRSLRGDVRPDLFSDLANREGLPMAINAPFTAETARHAIARVLAEHPDLCWAGFRQKGFKDFDELRLHTFGATEQVQYAAHWLSGVRRRQTVNFRNDAYGWKHVAERQLSERGLHCYIGEGSLIIAAIALGFRHHRTACGITYLNISQTARR